MPAMYRSPTQILHVVILPLIRSLCVGAPPPRIRLLLSTSSLAVAAAGCSPATVHQPASLVAVDAAASEGLAVWSSGGPAPLSVRVRSVDSWGTTVPRDEPALLTVNGETLSVELSESGTGDLVLADPGRYLISADGLDPIAVDVWEGEWPGPDAARVPGGPEGAPAHAFGGEGAGWVAYGAPSAWTSVWWIPSTGEPSQVLAVPAGDAVTGGAAADLDGDPWPDLAVWGPSGVTLLRGVEDGPPVLARRLRATLPVLDLAVGDVDGDGLDDLAAAFLEGEARTVEVLATDSQLQFPLLYRLELVTDPVAVAIGWDADADVPLLDVLDADSRFDHYVLDRAEGFVLAGSHDAVAVAPGAGLTGGHDFNSDGSDDLFVFGPRADGVPRELTILDLTARPITYVERTPVGAWAAVADADADRSADLWTLDNNGALRVLARGAEEPIEWNVADLPTAGPVAAVAPIDGDVPDLLVAGEDGGWWPGEREPGGRWQIRDAPADALLEGMIDVYGPLDLGGGPRTVAWSGVQDRSGVLYVKSWSRTDGEPTVHELGRVALAADPASFVDADRCGDRVWVLDGGGLHAVAVHPPVTVLMSWPDVRGTAIACAGDWGVVLDAGALAFRSPDHPAPVDVVARGALGVAAAPAADPATPPLTWTCDTPGCRVAWWQTGATGVRVISDPIATYLEGDRSVELPGPATASLTALVSGGAQDLLLARPDGRLTAVRATPDGPGAPRAWWLRRPLAGPAFTADADGDGDHDLFVIEEGGRLVLLP